MRLQNITLKEINAGLEIVKLNGEKFFTDKSNTWYYQPSGYCLKHKDLGYLALNDKFSPYTPVGGRKALKEILGAGGFIRSEGIIFLQAM